MNNLFNAMQNTTSTENGAVTLRDTGSALLDLFYHGATKRGQAITSFIEAAWNEDRLLTTVIMFYIRNVRGTGQGERDAFNQFLNWLLAKDKATFVKIARLVPEYGYWKDLMQFYTVPEVVELVHEQLRSDYKSKNPSLLAKWMPTINASSKVTRTEAWHWITALNTNRIDYQNSLVKIRRAIRTVESQMTANQWNEVDYSRVPSKAMKNYRKAFSKHDATRFCEYLEAANNGEVKINSSTLYPYELVCEYVNAFGPAYRSLKVDATIEAQWKQLPNYVEGNHSMLVMADVSGSMFQQDNMPINSSVGLAIYLAERNTGIWHNQFITFTNKPKLITLTGNTLADKVSQVFNDVGYNTNFQAGFDAILTAAKRNNLKQEDLPAAIIAISDMEFDNCGSSTNFEQVKEKYAKAGYTMPTMVFWNVASRNKQTPVNMNEQGVKLVSGHSPSIFKSIMSGNSVTPYDTMLEVLSDAVFDAVREVLA